MTVKNVVVVFKCSLISSYDVIRFCQPKYHIPRRRKTLTSRLNTQNKPQTPLYPESVGCKGHRRQVDLDLCVRGRRGGLPRHTDHTRDIQPGPAELSQPGLHGHHRQSHAHQPHKPRLLQPRWTCELWKAHL